MHLSAALRMPTPSVEAVQQALYDDRTVVRHHGMRRTLWVGTPERVRLIHGAATRKLVGPERRRTLGLLSANGVADPDRWLDTACGQVLGALREHGSLTARAIGELVSEARLPLRIAPGTRQEATIGAHTRVLLQLGFEGQVLRGRPTGSWVSGAYEYVPADQWLEGGLGDLDERTAAGRLANAWLWRFGPATSLDLQWWMGWTKTLTRHALADGGAVPVDLDGEPAWVAAGDDAAEPGTDPWVAVLPSLDPTVMGWKQRDWYLDEACADAFDRNGNAGPTLWVDGRVVGAWAQDRQGDLLTHYFRAVPAARRRQLDDELDRVSSLAGETRFSVRFPGRVNARILA